MQWFLVNLPNCAAIVTNFRTFPSLLKETSSLFARHSHLLSQVTTIDRCIFLLQQLDTELMLSNLPSYGMFLVYPLPKNISPKVNSVFDTKNMFS